MKCAIEKARLDNAGRLRGKEFKETLKHARRKLEIPIEAAMLYNISMSQHLVTCSSTDNRKTNFACMVEADECARGPLEGSRCSPKDHADHIAGEGINF